jgi:hypothetical protein
VTSEVANAPGLTVVSGYGTAPNRGFLLGFLEGAGATKLHTGVLHGWCD